MHSIAYSLDNAIFVFTLNQISWQLNKIRGGEGAFGEAAPNYIMFGALGDISPIWWSSMRPSFGNNKTNNSNNKHYVMINEIHVYRYTKHMNMYTIISIGI